MPDAQRKAVIEDALNTAADWPEHQMQLVGVLADEIERLQAELADRTAAPPVADAGSPSESIWQPFNGREDWLRDQHAKYHDQSGNMLGCYECREQHCDFWDAAEWVLDAEQSVVRFTFADGEQLGCLDCTAGEPHACPFAMADRMPEPRRSRVLDHMRAALSA